MIVGRWTKVLVEAVEVVVVDHRRAPHDPGVGGARLGVAALLGAGHGGALLGLADEQHPLLEGGSSPVGQRQVVLALPLAERAQVDPLPLGEALDGLHEAAGHGSDGGRRDDREAQVVAYEPRDSAGVLEPGDVPVEVHPIDRLDFVGDVLA